MSVESTGCVLGRVEAEQQPRACLRSPFGRRQVRDEDEALARRPPRPRGSSRGARAARWRSSAAGPAPGAKPRGCTVRSRAKLRSNSSSIELQEARAEAVDGDDQREADHQRGRGRGGAGRVRARRVGGEPALDRRQPAQRPREHPRQRRDQERRQHRDPEEDRDRADDPRGDDDRGRLVGGAEPEGPGEPGHDQQRPDHGARGRGRVADALGPEHRADRRDPPGAPRRVERAEHGGEQPGARPRRPAPIAVEAKLADREPERAHQLDQPQRQQHPEPDPEHRADQAEQRSASIRTERTIIRRVAPSVRCMPISRIRCSTVMLKRVEDQEAADEQRHRRRRSRGRR